MRVGYPSMKLANEYPLVATGVQPVATPPQLVELVRPERAGITDDAVAIAGIGIVRRGIRAVAHEDVARRLIVVVPPRLRVAAEQRRAALELVIQPDVTRIHMLGERDILDV